MSAILRIDIPGYCRPFEQTIKRLEPKKSLTIDPLNLQLDHIKLQGLEFKSKSRLTVSVDNHVLFESDINVLGYYEWIVHRDFALALAGFVQPANPVVNRIVIETENSLSSLSYIFEEKIRPAPVAESLSGLYTTLSEQHDIYYRKEPAVSYEYGCQVIRPHHAVLPHETEGSSGEGTCIDLCLLMAACLENMHFQPLIVVLQTFSDTQHALLGCWKKQDHRVDPLMAFDDFKQKVESGDLILLEATGISRDAHGEKRPFEDALISSDDPRLVPDRFVFALDISAARLSVLPLQFPMRPGVTDIIREAGYMAHLTQNPKQETMHLLAGFFFAPLTKDPFMAALIKRLDLNLEALRHTLRIMVETVYPKKTGPAAHPRPTLNFRRVIEDAKLISVDTNMGFVEYVHLFYALMQTQSRTTLRILEKIHIRPVDVIEMLNKDSHWSGKMIRTDMALPEPTESLPPPPPLSHGIYSWLLAPAWAESMPDESSFPIPFVKGLAIPDSPYRVGDPIGDLFILLDLIGRGSMGDVYLALSLADHTHVALKALHPHLIMNPEARKLLLKEAKICVDLSRYPHSNLVLTKHVVQLGDRMYIGSEAILDDSEHLRSSTLRLRLQTSGPFSDQTVITWAFQLADGMIHALSHGLAFHGDLRPENLFIDSNGILKIGDFGLAAMVNGSGLFTTAAGHEAYMAPERFSRKASPTPVSDIYSIGLILYELCTGRHPFEWEDACFIHADDWRSFWKKRHESEVVPILDSPLQDIVQRCLSKNQQDRYQTIDDLKSDLRLAARALSMKVTHLPTPAQASAPDALHIGLNCFALEDYVASLGWFEQILKSDQNHIFALCAKGYCLLAMDKASHALTVFKRVCVLSGDIRGLAGQAVTLAKLGRYSDAGPFFEQAIAINPNIAALWYHKGQYHLQRRETNDAGHSWHKALDILIRRKRHAEAEQVMNDCIKEFPDDLRFQQLKGWLPRIESRDEETLTRSLSSLGTLYHSPDVAFDTETAGLLAGTHKRLYVNDPITHAESLSQALKLYEFAYTHSKGNNIYVGINAASLSFLAGHAKKARKLAQAILDRCNEGGPQNLPEVGPRFSSYWYWVTRAEAELLLGHLGKARRMYADIMNQYSDHRAYIESSLEQLDLILPHVGPVMPAATFVHQTRPNETAVSYRSRFIIGLIVEDGVSPSSALNQKLAAVIHRIKQIRPKGFTTVVNCQIQSRTQRHLAQSLSRDLSALIQAYLPESGNDHAQFIENRMAIQKFMTQMESVNLVPRSDQTDSLTSLITENSDILIRITAHRDTKVSPSPRPTAVITADGAAKTRYHSWEHPMLSTQGETTMYSPKPIDTKKITLSEDMVDLTELLAQNAHDIWALKRIEEGWRYGSQRNDETREHPCLVPYDELPDSEKEYDRAAALETLKLIKALGFNIVSHDS